MAWKQKVEAGMDFWKHQSQQEWTFGNISPSDPEESIPTTL